MALVKFDNGNRSGAINPWLTDVLDNFFNDSYFSDRMVSRVPAVNISETDTSYQVEMAAPGLRKEDFKINLDRNTLSISAEKKEESNVDGRKFDRREYSYTSFVRSFTLPEIVDPSDIHAEYMDGILTIKVGKREEARTQPRSIEVH